MTPDFTRAQIAAACKLAQIEPVPMEVDGAQLLWAIAGNESSFGFNCTPRYEPAFDRGGPYADIPMLNRFGRDAACSWGPWQIMFANCPPDYAPEDMKDLTKAVFATAAFLNHQLYRFEPTSLAAIAAIWNGGNPGAIVKPQVAAYAAKLESNYLIPMEAA